MAEVVGWLTIGLIPKTHLGSMARLDRRQEVAVVVHNLTVARDKEA